MELGFGEAGGAVAFMALGLALLAAGGDCVVRGGVGVAGALRLSPLFVGIVLLGFGTSLPELLTSVQSVRLGEPDVAIGNVVGSNIANILLIVGAAAALSSAAVERRLLARNGVAMSLSVALLAVLLITQLISATTGLGLVLLLVVYLIFVSRGRRPTDDPSCVVRTEERQPFSLLSGVGLSLIVFLIGLVLTLAGASVVVSGAVSLAEQAQISKAVIGATIIAVGTSLPELAATIAAAWRGRSSLAVGNVLGSNIFNSLGVIGVAAFFGPMPTPDEVLRLDVWAMLAAAALFMVCAALGGRITRLQGGVFLALYAGYLWLAATSAI